MDRCTAALLRAPTSPLWLCIKVRMHRRPSSAPQRACRVHKGLPGVKGARWGKERGAGPCRHPAQGLKPSVRLCSEKPTVCDYWHVAVLWRYQQPLDRVRPYEDTSKWGDCIRGQECYNIFALISEVRGKTKQKTSYWESSNGFEMEV